MKVLTYHIMPQNELLALLKRTPLRGSDPNAQDKVEVYKTASLRIVEQVDTNILTPPQRYVLSGSVLTVLNLADEFESHGIDIFSLNGALMFWPEGTDPEKDRPIPFLPPIVEDSIERDGKTVMLINDGMHRVYAARKRGRRINIVHATNVPVEYPYYAYAFLEGWPGVQEFNELPDEFQKKDYRRPDQYKELFRQFNVVFPGVQEQRKQSNPAHIKA